LRTTVRTLTREHDERAMLREGGAEPGDPAVKQIVPR
jgi:hypothetical protein